MPATAQGSKISGFLTKHRARLEVEEPESIKLLLATLPTSPGPKKSLAEQLALADSNSKEDDTGHQLMTALDGPVGAGVTEANKLAKREELGRWLAAYGRERTMPSRETKPEEQVYQVGLEETKRWHGNYRAMPTPAFCTVCNIRIPHATQAEAHFEGGI